MRKIILLLILPILFLTVGCSQTLADQQQQENLLQLDESWQKISSDLLGVEDDPATPEDETIAPRIPARPIIESHGDLLREAKELELAKKETWQDQATSNDWEPKK